MITEKQINFIILKIESNVLYSRTLKKFWMNQPTHNEKYQNKKANYKRIIFEDKLKRLNSQQASYLIKLLIDNNYKKFTNLLN